MKQLRLKRDELIWETREAIWTEQDWIRFVEWYKERAAIASEHEHPTYAQAIYAVIKDMSWDEAVHQTLIYNGDEEGEEIRYSVYHEGYNWVVDEDGMKVPQRDSSADWCDSLSIGHLILQAMREDCYESDVIDTNYADDYDENLYSEEEY